MRYSELKTWEDFAKALSQNPDPRNLTYLITGLNQALSEKPREKDFHSSTAHSPTERRPVSRGHVV
jgi:hypothetical protein